jgi:glycosyltransferase involved in cell wall biosynthesis
MSIYSGRLGLQQRVLPAYRVPFFDLLAETCAGGMSLFAGNARPNEMIRSGVLQISKFTQAQNIHIFSGPLYLCYQRGLMNWLEEWNPDSLIVEANPRYLATPSAVRWMHARGRKVLGWGLGASPLTLGPSPREAPPKGAGRGVGVRARFINQFDGMISYSQRGAQEYAALGFPREKIFVAPNAVSPAPARNPDRGRRATDRATILFVGRLQARKRVDALLRACSEIDPNPRLIIVGDGPERAALQSLAQQVYPAAEFPGERHGTELASFFEEADLFVLPGTGGLAVQQAMSHGLPVIVAKGDGTQDDLVRAGNGWQIPAEDYPALLVAMKDALSEPARLRRMGAESFRIVSEEINIQKMADVFVKALNAIA